MVVQPTWMSHLIVEEEQRLPGAAFNDVQLTTSGLDQLFSPRHGSGCHDAAPTFHLCGKGPSPYLLKGRGSKSQAMRQKLDVGILAWTFLGCQKGWPETPGNCVLVSVESHEASSFVVRSFVLQLSLPQGEASIIIKPLQPTTASVCACVAPTSGGGSPPAFDRATKEVDMAHGEK